MGQCQMSVPRRPFGAELTAAIRVYSNLSIRMAIWLLSMHAVQSIPCGTNQRLATTVWAKVSHHRTLVACTLPLQTTDMTRPFSLFRPRVSLFPSQSSIVARISLVFKNNAFRSYNTISRSVSWLKPRFEIWRSSTLHLRRVASSHDSLAMQGCGFLGSITLSMAVSRPFPFTFAPEKAPISKYLEAVIRRYI